jgi:hypothetical protein
VVVITTAVTERLGRRTTRKIAGTRSAAPENRSGSRETSRCLLPAMWPIAKSSAGAGRSVAAPVRSRRSRALAGTAARFLPALQVR